MKIANDILYIGVNDHEIDLFEGQYAVPNGMAYNSYLILDEKTAVIDSVDRRFTAQWLSQLQDALGGRMPDYLIVHHMEPDHSASICAFMDAYPQATVVASAKAFPMMKNFFGEDYPSRRMIVSEGSTLELGRHSLSFITAPMVHWPEVIMTYEKADGILFSADAFGKFGALDVSEDWACEARRYYFGIIGKYGAQVQAVLKKAAAFEIKTICPLHGPVLTGDLTPYLSLYQTWSSYGVESEGVVIACASIYGHTLAACEYLEQKLLEGGCPTVVLTDLARCDIHEAVEDAFRYGKLVLASSTYNADVFPCMKSFIHKLAERGYRNRTIALMENGSWAPTAAKVMRGMVSEMKNVTLLEPDVRILSALSDESREQIDALAKQLLG